MPIVDDPDAPPDGRLLLADDGRLLARFRHATGEGYEWALGLRPADGVAPGELARGLRGRRVPLAPPLAEVLIAAGGRAERRSQALRHSLGRLPAAWARDEHAGVRIQPVDRPAEALAPAFMAAYGPGHPDFLPRFARVEGVTEEIRAMLDGEIAGPLLACSRLGVDQEDRVVGAALVTDQPPPGGGPLLADLHRHPRHAGLGGALLRRTLWQAAADGLPELRLAVTDGNPAFRLYEAHGFTVVQTWIRVAL